MIINTEKTKAMLVTTQQRHTRIDDNLNILLNNVQLLTVSNEKVLGDNNLLWGQHVRKVMKKMSSDIWLLSKVKNYLSKEQRVMYYKSYIQPHLGLCKYCMGKHIKNKFTTNWKTPKESMQNNSWLQYWQCISVHEWFENYVIVRKDILQEGKIHV